MIHLLTDQSRSGAYRVYWKLDTPIEGQDTLRLDFARVALGITWNEIALVVAVGERVIERPRGVDRYFVVLDEYEADRPQVAFDAAVDLKDRYKAAPLFAPHDPVLLVDSLRNTEGLTHYRTESYADAERRWPHFVDFDQTCGVYPLPTPDEQTLHRTLDRWLNTPVVDPASGDPLADTTGEPLFRLQVPVDFPTRTVRTGLQTAAVGPGQALYFAGTGLERSPPPRSRPSREEPWEHKPGRGGY